MSKEAPTHYPCRGPCGGVAGACGVGVLRWRPQRGHYRCGGGGGRMTSVVVVTRRRHPLEGQSLRELGRMRRHGRLELLLVLPDGSKSLLGTEVGDLDLATLRDRNGSFEPQLVPKGTRRLGGLSDMIISLYAGGMTIRDIQAHLERTLGTQLSQETISNITDAVAEEVKAWQSRPLEPIYPIMYLDALVEKVKESNQVRNKAAHIAVGVDCDGIKHVLGIWVQTSEGAKFWAGVLAELCNGGVADVLVACVDGLTGFPEAIEATFRTRWCKPVWCI